jgi:hypothetical protein
MSSTFGATKIFTLALLPIAGCRETAKPQAGAFESPEAAGAPAAAVERSDVPTAVPRVGAVEDEAGQPGQDVTPSEPTEPTMPGNGSLLVETDCKAGRCLGATVAVRLGNRGFLRHLDDGGTAMIDALPLGEAIVTVRHDADPSHPLLGEAKVELSAGRGARVTVAMVELDASATVSGVLVERSGRRASTKSGGSLVIDVSCQGFQRRITAAANGTFSAPHLLPGPCTFTGLRIDPKDPMSGMNGGRIPTRLNAPAHDVEVRVNDFFHR